MSVTLAAAAVYNLVWGAWVVLRPSDLFVWTGIDPPNYLGIWQCVGMIVGVYGVGYGIAAIDPLRHWPITLVGLLGKIFGPIGFLFTILTVQPGDPGYLPLSWGWTIVTNDLIWWIPFAGILYQTFRHAIDPAINKSVNISVNKSADRDSSGVGGSDHIDELSVGQANEVFVNQHGKSIAELSADSPLLLLFLRHSGCTFCREALADLSKQQTRLRDAGVKVVLVHQGDPAKADTEFAVHDLADVDRISDPMCRLYRAYDLHRGRFGQLFGPRVWWRGFQAAILDRHGVGKLDGDGFQMPGAFLVHQNEIVRSYRHQTAADRPDVCELAIR